MMRVMLLALLITASGMGRAGEVWLVDIDGAIGPAVADHVVRAIERGNQAEAGTAELIILRMNTPGGLDRAMRDIIKQIMASRVPVVGFVAPQGSRAASAGTYILYASHIAAMAPATNLGAATPVQLGGATPLPLGGQDDKASDSKPDAKQRKVLNDAVAYIRGLAEERGRNAEWAESAVTEAATLTAQAALEAGVIDLIADNPADLLKQLHGRTVATSGGERQLDTENTTINVVEPDWRSQFLQVITDPNIAYLLLMLGIYGLIFEFSNPGVGVGGIVGGICLLLAAYALQLLPISYSALGLMLLGLGLLAAEALSPSVGILGLGGIIAFVVGSIMLMDSNVPGYDIALPVIIAVAISSALLLLVILNLLRKTHRRPAVSGLSTLTGTTAQVARLHKGRPMIRLDGEWWQVRCNTPLSVNDTVRVVRAEGLVLEVEKEN